jgi:hypothetical protein
MTVKDVENIRNAPIKRTFTSCAASCDDPDDREENVASTAVNSKDNMSVHPQYAAVQNDFLYNTLLMRHPTSGLVGPSQNRSNNQTPVANRTRLASARVEFSSSRAANKTTFQQGNTQ